MLKILLAAVVAASLQGCTVLRDPRDAPWDPRHPSQMLHQLPNWDQEGLRRCGGTLYPEDPTRSKKC